jgi:rSAM/selenodomain-associated transferase 2/rSAM/selenodomain-associated transferase 1
MKLSIVMPVLDEGRQLAAALRRLGPMRERGAQLVVADGGSRDETWAIARAHADRLVLAQRGRAAQMNAGARCSSGDVLLFLHADTELPPAADSLIGAALAQGAQWGRFDVRIDGHERALRLVERLMNWRSRWTGVATGDQAIFVRRDVFESLGGYADLALMEDVELSKRLKRRARPACLRETVVTSARRWQRNGVWRTMALMWRLRLGYVVGADPRRLALRYGYSPRDGDDLAAPAAIAVLARAPQAGRAKTRLIPALGATGAARAQRRFCLQTLHAAQAYGPAALTLWCAPDDSQRFFRAVHRHAAVTCRAQADGTLGERMLHAFAAHFQAGTSLPLLLIGTDCPVLAPAHLRQAARALVTHDVVLTPAEDGGYVLIGMRRMVAQAFDAIDWSTPAVLAQTRERLRIAGVSWHELEPLWDVDEPADWDRLQQLEQRSD